MSLNLTITRHDDPPDTMTIAFSEPLEFRGGAIEALELREPTAKECREAEKEFTSENPWASRQAYELKLISLVAGISATAADALPIGAANYAAAFLMEFCDAGAGDPADLNDEVPDGPVCVTLDKPITFVGTTYTEIDLREPLASEIRKARLLMRTAGSLFEGRRSQMMLLTAVSGLPAPVIDALPVRKLNECGRILSRFTMAGRPTGKT